MSKKAKAEKAEKHRPNFPPRLNVKGVRVTGWGGFVPDDNSTTVNVYTGSSDESRLPKPKRN
jgi:hypothetical protein